MDALRGKVAVVTGATRGIGKGIAVGLGEAGATVYVTGRSTREDGGSLPGTIDETAIAVTKLGGVGIAVRCDHRMDGDVEAVFQRVRRESGRLDFLVNNAFASPEQRVLWSGLPFWQLPISMWDDLVAVGLRSNFVASRFAVPLMLEHGEGVIVNVSSHAAASVKPVGSKRTVPYSVVKAALHRLTADMATELRGAGVAVVGLWPPATKTEGVLAQQDVWGDLSDWNSPLFTGRVLASFLAQEDAFARTGEALEVEELAKQLGIVDPAT
ncbi:MAG TPA: SDR family NAD(P)-dependent oxidoreductase [Candidatus Limnocylindrales bacterium]|nr:SDR family NAD(P)-dependent oxidoreductase [Candidatus Limnocylindrales bacterium]